LLEFMARFFGEAIAVLSAWLPQAVAKITVYTVAGSIVLVPAMMLGDLIYNRWWRRLRQVQRRLISWSAATALFLGYFDATPPYTIPEAPYVALTALLVAAGGILYSLLPWRRSSPAHDGWETRPETFPGFPVVTWFQDVDTGRQQKHAIAGIEAKMILGVLVAGSLIGLFLGGPSGALIGFFIACYLAPAANRYAVPPRLENVGGYTPMPGRWSERQPTEVERQIDNEPIVETWQGQAVIVAIGGKDLIEGEPAFEVRWRRPDTGEVRLLCHKPWASLSSIELDSYGKLFVGRTAPLPYHEPWVITARVDGQHLLEVARDMGGQARLQTVFAQLILRFGIERRNAFMLERATERKRRGLDRLPMPPQIPSETGFRNKPKL
jgi:hypothetical protein